VEEVDDGEVVAGDVLLLREDALVAIEGLAGLLNVLDHALSTALRSGVE
jgi:hypothetical protein